MRALSFGSGQNYLRAFFHPFLPQRSFPLFTQGGAGFAFSALFPLKIWRGNFENSVCV